MYVFNVPLFLAHVDVFTAGATRAVEEHQHGLQQLQTYLIKILVPPSRRDRYASNTFLLVDG